MTQAQEQLLKTRLANAESYVDSMEEALTTLTERFFDAEKIRNDETGDHAENIMQNTEYITFLCDGAADALSALKHDLMMIGQLLDIPTGQ